MILTIEEAGAQAGMQAAELYKAGARDGVHEAVRRILPDAVKAAEAEAENFRDSDSEDENPTVRTRKQEVVSCSVADPPPTPLKTTLQPRKPSWRPN
ncbi:hypothetical protein IVB22_32365 [Bradyrhizobium sp. 190]|uniref:hypothetical protein n=1 Tax=Bradyrhizobium sp. 190 TaxID=2782658 RepID=UPI001FFAF8AC|nr:hypothetical protein [Bradyrhizobium sp. 190]MCK1517117.1 hypothetical protein [Bradyrhizobium sp. 190]